MVVVKDKRIHLSLFNYDKAKFISVCLSVVLILNTIKYLFSSESLFSKLPQLFLFCFIITGNILLFRNLLHGLRRIDRIYRLSIMSLIGLVTFAIFRAYLAGTLTATEFITNIIEYPLAMALIIGSYCYFIERDLDKVFIRIVKNNLFLYLAANLILYLIIGSSAQAGYSFTGESKLLSLVGINVSRVYFPLSPGINSFGSIAGVAFALSIMIWIYDSRVINFLFIFISFVCVISVDSRVALLMSISAVCVTLVFWRWRKFAVFVPLLIPVVYALLPLIAKFISTSPLVDQLTRNSSETTTFGGRAIIWLQFLEEYANFRPLHLIGYGMYGQQTSKVSSGYISIFLDYLGDKPERMSLHSGYFQNLMDYGYLGLTLIIVLNMILIYRVVNSVRQSQAKIVLCAILSLLMIGITEPVPTLYSHELFYVYFMLFVIGYGMNRKMGSNL